jgi:TnpA family transposase
MPVSFLSEEYRKSYARFAGEPSPEQLARYFYLDDVDLLFVSSRRGDHSRLGIAVQLGTVRFLGTFLDNPLDVPGQAIGYLASQLDIDPKFLTSYRDRQVSRRHAREIREKYGFRDFGVQPKTFHLIRWLYTRAWLTDERPTLLFDMATSWLLDQKILLPGVSVLERLVARIRERANARLWRLLFGATTRKQRDSLEALLVEDGSGKSPLDRLRPGPTRVSSPSFIAAIRRWEAVQELGIGEIALSHIPPQRIKALARFVHKSWAAHLLRMSEERRIGSLVAFIATFESSAIDDALDVLELLLSERFKSAQKEGEKEIVRTRPALASHARELLPAILVILDEDEVDDDKVREVVFEQISRKRLAEAVDNVKLFSRPNNEHVQERLIDRYSAVRRFLPTLLRSVEFEGVKAGHPTLEALRFLTSIEGRRKPDMRLAPLKGMSKSWRSFVLDREKRVDRRAYTLFALEKLHESMRRRDVFVTSAEKWGDPRSKLLQGPEWKAARSNVLRTLNLNTSPEETLEGLSRRLDESYLRTAKNVPGNKDLSFEEDGEFDRVVLAKLDKLEEPESLLVLRKQVKALLPQTELPEVLLEIHAHTGFLDEFTHASEGESRASEITISLCAVLLGEACNVGLEPLVRADIPALTRDRLSWVQQNYIRPETLIPANARLVEAQTHIPLAEAWGGGEVASADGLRFVVSVRTLNAGPNPKYFGSGRGITYYNFVSDQLTGFHGIVVPGTLRDSMFLLGGLLEQETVLEPQEIMTDTAGYSDLVFGLFWLLGYRFSPRLSGLGKRRFWRFETDAHYGPFQDLARHRINRQLIRDNWEDMLRVAGSLKLGTVRAIELTRSLLRNSRPTTLARAIAELGKVPKTLHLLDFVDDSNYRRRILKQLNRSESRHKKARAVCHGQRGEIRKRYREGQEDQLNALGLVLNAMVLWNTMYMDIALDHLRASGCEVRPEDVARLSPLETNNINVLGRYTFALPESVARGQLRPLRDLGEGELKV